MLRPPESATDMLLCRYYLLGSFGADTMKCPGTSIKNATENARSVDPHVYDNFKHFMVRLLVSGPISDKNIPA